MKKIVITLILILIITIPTTLFIGSHVEKQADMPPSKAVPKTAPEEKIDLDAYPILKVALAEEGNTGGEKFWQWYGFEEHVLWCACYVSWCANEMNYLDSDIIPRFASCQREGIPWFKERGQWEGPEYTPNSADLIFFDLNGNGVPNHVAFVILAEDNKIYTIEGNAGDVCKKKEYDADDPRIFGYGVPEYPEI